MVKDTFDIEIESLKVALDRDVESQILSVIDIIIATKGKLIVIGVGKSGLVGAKIAATLASTGTPSFFIHPTEALHGDLGMIGKDDTILAISYSGESEELIKILPHIKRFDIPLIAMCGKSNSTLCRYADRYIDISVPREACPFNAAPTSSTTLTMVIGDAIAVELMSKRSFKKEDFAMFHPGGTIGKRLYIKVEDIMRTSNLPIISKDIPLREAIIIMTNHRLGSALIVDINNTLVAILTDGDLRRAMMTDNFSVDSSAYQYSTISFTVCQDSSMLAIDALTIIENKKIQILPVVNNENNVIGVLHIHDIVEKGIT